MENTLNGPNIYKWLQAVLFDWAIIVTCLFTVFLAMHWDNILRFVVYFFAMLIISCRQHALLVLGHESVHRLVSRKKSLNDFLGNLLTFNPCFASMESYREFHFAHHLNLGTTKDPEQDGKLELGKLGIFWELPRSKWKFYRELVLSLVGIRFYVMIVYLFGFRPKTKQGILLMATQWLVFLTLFYITDQWWILGMWLWALFTATWTGFWFRIWTEHTGIGDTHRISLTWWQKFLFLPHNICYHWEHHQKKYQQVPFWALPIVRELNKEPEIVPMWQLIKNFDNMKPYTPGE